MQFFIQVDSEIPASTQLYDQISFAITSRQYLPGHQLPSTRQLAQWTGLHRNTINKVYQQLKQTGLVEAKGGSGIYVLSSQTETKLGGVLPQQIVQQGIDKLLNSGCSLTEAKDLFLAEIDWRLSCSAKLLVPYGHEDPGVAMLLAEELEQSLAVAVQTISLTNLPQVLEHSSAGTIVTNRYFLEAIRQVVGNHPLRIFVVDIYNYSREIERLKELPTRSYVGLVSISTGILRLAESLIHSLRGDDLLVVSVLPQDTYRLRTIARSANLIITGTSGREALKAAIAATRHERIRPVEVMYSDNYIASESIELLKRELNLKPT